MAKRREPCDVRGVELVPAGAEVVEASLDVDGLAQHDDAHHEAECAQLALLAGL